MKRIIVNEDTFERIVGNYDGRDDDYVEDITSEHGMEVAENLAHALDRYRSSIASRHGIPSGRYTDLWRKYNLDGLRKELAKALYDAKNLTGDNM